jgi:hypothetical protein
VVKVEQTGRGDVYIVLSGNLKEIDQLDDPG